ncbi:MAG: methanogenesis marker 6 protein [Candidatus Methanoliparum thermophilum]|uniref:Methanogenesis marker 6 protein n=1 Tax=Methanoliparum thermophilum TaxID=2491083 RepID=A0A520KTE6_METT2|nr:methanogenesis marker 6 protein [Candidatus Methanoliparum sp. LAM-1]RZN65020.1 MAG: methanogenesis marker 6 protein [Candidatus Methanoliparum thermophilum]BDC36093.1 methanogenesis marker 6 protein [Candidatus Methanoliparum sp. LAM-1]
MSKITKIIVSPYYLPIIPKLYEKGFDLIIKETCYGVMISGEEKDVKDAVDFLRKEFKNSVFIKDRGFPPGEKVRCRADRGGGGRPGFHQLEYEISMLPNIEKALNEIYKSDKKTIKKKKKRIGIDKLQSIIKENVPL